MTQGKVYNIPELLESQLETCRHYLAIQHPWITGVDTTGLNKVTWEGWINEQVDRYGHGQVISPVHWEDREKEVVREVIREHYGDNSVTFFEL